MSSLGSAGSANQGGINSWSRSDKISCIAAVVSFMALVISAIQPISSLADYILRPQVGIQYPSDGMRMANNTFNAHGTEERIPSSSDLWLVVRSGVEGRWYPVTRLSVSSGQWSIGDDVICPGSGLQDIQIYLVPDTGEEELFAYVRGSKSRQSLGMDSMPPGAVLEATHAVNVAPNSSDGC